MSCEGEHLQLLYHFAHAQFPTHLQKHSESFGSQIPADFHFKSEKFMKQQKRGNDSPVTPLVLGVRPSGRYGWPAVFLRDDPEGKGLSPGSDPLGKPHPGNPELLVISSAEHPTPQALGRPRLAGRPGHCFR